MQTVTVGIRVNSAPPTFLKSAPKRLINWLASMKASNHFTQYDVALATRLLTHLDMGRVWEELTQLAKDCEDESLVDEFFDLVIFSDRRWGRMSRTPKAAAASKLRGLARSCEQVADDIDRLQPEIAMQHALFPTTEELLDRARGASPIGHLHAQKQQGTTPLQDVLREAARSLRRDFSTVDAELRPTKPNADTADRTYMVRVLASYFEETHGAPKYTLVASTVTAAFNLADPLEPGHAQKLAGDLFQR